MTKKKVAGIPRLEQINRSGTVVYRRRQEQEANSANAEGLAADLPFHPLVVPDPLTPNDLPPQNRELAELLSHSTTVHSVFATGVIAAFSPVFKLPGLPADYFFKGGPARESLRRLLHPQSKSIPCRDFDLVRFVHATDREDHHLSLRHMADDYEFGRGVEVVEDIATYLATRDLSVNEVILRPGWMSVSFAALRDTLRNTLRPTPFVTDVQGLADGRTVVKAARIAAEALHFGSTYTLADCTPGRVTAFDLALHLDRSFATHTAVATEYILQLFQHGLLPKTFLAPPDPAQLIRWIEPQLPAGITFFRNLPQEIIRQLLK